MNASNVSGANFVWDGGGSDNLCSNPLNWSGDVAPGSGDTAIFNTTSSKAATLDCELGDVAINGYSGTITLAQSISLSTYTQSSGHFCYC